MANEDGRRIRGFGQHHLLYHFLAQSMLFARSNACFFPHSPSVFVQVRTICQPIQRCCRSKPLQVKRRLETLTFLVERSEDVGEGFVPVRFCQPDLVRIGNITGVCESEMRSISRGTECQTVRE